MKKNVFFLKNAWLKMVEDVGEMAIEMAELLIAAEVIGSDKNCVTTIIGPV